MQQAIKQLIVTRPENQAVELVEQLKLRLEPEVKVIQQALLKIESIDFTLAEGLAGLNHYNGVIFISRHAAQYFYAALNKQQITDLSQSQLFAVGENSAAYLQSLSQQEVIFPQQMNAEGLLQLPALQQVKNQRWLIVKGEAGRQLIQQQLIQRGAQVDQLDVYQRCLPSFDKQQAIVQLNQAHSVWLISSAEALSNLHRILGLSEQTNHQVKVIVSSLRLLTIAKNKGFDVVVKPLGASTQQLLESVESYLKADA
jgi:uroporphyrinogen-III synthase